MSMATRSGPAGLSEREFYAKSGGCEVDGHFLPRTYEVDGAVEGVVIGTRNPCKDEEPGQQLSISPRSYR